MKFRTERKTETVTVVRGEETAVFEIQPPTRIEISDIVRKHTPPIERKGDTVFEHPANMLEMQLDMLQGLIVKWDISDENNNLIPCTRENIRKVALLAPDIFDEVVEKGTEFTEQLAKESEESLKN